MKSRRSKKMSRLKTGKANRKLEPEPEYEKINK